jgi:hypothetical protein
MSDDRPLAVKSSFPSHPKISGLMLWPGRVSGFGARQAACGHMTPPVDRGRPGQSMCLSSTAHPNRSAGRDSAVAWGEPNADSERVGH